MVAAPVMYRLLGEAPLTGRWVGLAVVMQVPAAGKRVPMPGVPVHGAQGLEAAVGLDPVAIPD